MDSNGQGGNWRDGGSGRRRRVAQHCRRRNRAVSRRRAAPRRGYVCDPEPGMNCDCHSRHGAEMLARRIETYWRSLGFNVRTWLVPLEAAAPDPRPRNALKSDRLGALWLVRSSLANGLPPGRGNPFHGAKKSALPTPETRTAGVSN
ncbi:MAG: hypothetical protein QF894_13645 [Alphaproteobacteria bacterium]|nr:hypothetical protein [Alphaproteobacteria bacterium]|tara:strand:+ start:187 stop:627 length:441 start_codon:yes stop_codon:yes gene_type:complete